MKKLDKNRPYATVHGGEGSDIPHCFEQDGVYFNAAGDEVGRDKNYKPPRGQSAPGGAQKSEREAALEQQMAAQREAFEREMEEAKAKAAAEAEARIRAELAATPGGAQSEAIDPLAQARALLADSFSDLTVADLQKMLKKKEIKFETDANKDRLVELLVEAKLAEQK